MQVVPMGNKDSFAQSFLPPLRGMASYVIESGKLVFKQISPVVEVGAPVLVKMIGAVQGATLLDSPLNVPKDVEALLLDRVLQILAQEYAVKRDVINDAIPVTAQ